jgi:hypothetical protein
MKNLQLRLASLTRGLYARVAHKLKVDPSYVSRVARGGRRSQEIEVQLSREVSKIVAVIAMPKLKRKKTRVETSKRN